MATACILVVGGDEGNALDGYETTALSSIICKSSRSTLPFALRAIISPQSTISSAFNHDKPGLVNGVGPLQLHRFSSFFGSKKLVDERGSKGFEYEVKSPKKFSFHTTHSDREEVTESQDFTELQLRGGFVKKVCGILAGQMALTTIVSSAAVLYSPFTNLIHSTIQSGGFVPYLICFSPLISMIPLYVYRKEHPLNLVILGLHTTCLSLGVATCCAVTDGKVVLESLVATSAMFSSLTRYTFWAIKKGKDFSCLGPILFPSLCAVLVTGIMELFFPVGSTTAVISSGFGAAVFPGYIVYDTQRLIKTFPDDEYGLYQQDCLQNLDTETVGIASLSQVSDFQTNDSAGVAS
ncbi:hypothetical protein RJ639_020622 [Escallonia herrerae]|uniref:Uncharacterized protein n=1 Tax=Escallonia herrerae TaxID=1293975 RepID=A0AA88V4G7_9ASTE|nr:hypothetical protein RJ639_020622 [Escallonia herrerae]